MNPPIQTPAWNIAHAETSLGWGGQERRIMAEVTGFRDRGCRTWILAPSNSKIFAVAQSAGISVLPISTSRLAFGYEVLRLARWLHRQNIQILNPHSSKDSWLLGVAGRLARTPLIVRSRHFDVPFGHHALSRIVYTRLADHIITTSPKVSEKIRSVFKLDSSRVSTISTGVDLKSFTPVGAKTQFENKLQNPSAPRIGMIGVFRNAKGHAILLEAAQHLNAQGLRAQYILVGEGPMLPLTRQKAVECGLSDQVLFTGERDDVPEILRSIDLLVMPSLHEAIPQVGLQALACQTPVVASEVGGLPTIILPGKTGRLVPPGDPSALATAIQSVFRESELTQKMRLEGRRLVEERHSLDRMLDLTAALYRESFAALGN